MHLEPSLAETQKEWHGTFKAYIIGFVLCILLTAASFLLVITKALSGYFLFVAIIALALVQATVQLLLFLHVGQEPKPRWETLVFYFMVMVLFIVAIGSIWIINDLDERTMSNMMMGFVL